MKPLWTPLLVAALAVTASGCANQHAKPLYGWGNYQQQVYSYLKADGDSNEQQIAALEENLAKLRARGDAVPPGYHAHLGLLYGSVGKDAQLVSELQTEQALFPESGPYMNFLLRRYRKEDAK